MPDREPIVSAVLADPVVKAVLSDPNAAAAVNRAVHPAGSAEVPAAQPELPPAAFAPAQAPVTTEKGTTTTTTAPPVITLPDGKVVASPTATEEEERVSAGQRTVNLIWETTQMRVALSVIWAALFVAAVLSVMGQYLGSPELQLAAVVFLFGVANLVTGFYFGRTNHQRIGGVDQGR